MNAANGATIRLPSSALRLSLSLIASEPSVGCATLEDNLTGIGSDTRSPSLEILRVFRCSSKNWIPLKPQRDRSRSTTCNAIHKRISPTTKTLHLLPGKWRLTNGGGGGKLS